MLTCRELSEMGDQLLDGGLPPARRLAARFHLFICANCRRFMRQLERLLRVLPVTAGPARGAVSAEAILRRAKES